MSAEEDAAIAEVKAAETALHDLECCELAGVVAAALARYRAAVQALSSLQDHART